MSIFDDAGTRPVSHGMFPLDDGTVKA